MHLWQQLQPQVFLHMMPQAWHTYLWAVLPIPLCSTSQAPSGWMGSVGAQPFSDLSRDVQSDSSLGSGWATQGTFTELSWSHSFDILAVCFGSLPCWKKNRRPNLRSRALWSRFLSRISLYIAAFIFPSILTSLSVPAAEKHPHSMMLPPPCFTVGMVLAWWWAVPGFLQTWRLAFTPKSSLFVSSDQRILFLMVWESIRCILAAMCLLLRSGYRHTPPSGHSTIQAWLVDCCRDGCPSGRFSSLHRGTLELWQSDHRVLGHLPD